MKVKIGVSACLVGSQCNFDGKDLFNHFVSSLQKNSEIELVKFCPEDTVFGTPRANLRIVDGDGHDVLDGKAKVIDENGQDVTSLQIQGAQKFLDLVKQSQIGCVILMDGSPSCGSNVLLKEEGWPRGGFKRGIGVTTALLKRNGIQIFGSFDELAISEFLATKLDQFPVATGLRNLKDLPKFKALFE